MVTSMLSTVIQYGWADRIMSDVLSATLRAAYAFKIVPDDFIEPVTVQILPRLR